MVCVIYIYGVCVIYIYIWCVCVIYDIWYMIYVGQYDAYVYINYTYSVYSVYINIHLIYTLRYIIHRI